MYSLGKYWVHVNEIFTYNKQTMGTGSLKCLEVFHIVFNSGDEKRFVQTIVACLQKTESRQRHSVAFSAIGTGVSGYPPAKAAKGHGKSLVLNKPSFEIRKLILV